MTDTASVQDAHASLKLGLKIAAGVLLVAGLGLGLLALAGPLGVWMGMSDFRAGFGFLQVVNAWADWIAILCLLGAVAIFAIGTNKQIPTTNKLGIMAMVGCVSAALAWYIPETFRPPKGTPAIHDIATDPYNPLQYIAIAPLRADAANNMDYGVMPGIDSVQQHIDMQQQAYPDIVPQEYDASADAIYERALAVVEDMGWELVSADPQSHRIEATDTTFWFRFKDDVVIEISAAGSNASVLQARSLSRVGRSDVGKNASRLREFFSRMRDV